MTDIKTLLKSYADEQYKNFHASLCPGADNIIGVRMPDLRKIAKQIAAGADVREYLDSIKGNSYEERVIEGLVIGYAKLSPEERRYYLKKFIPRIDSWAVCDTCCGNLKFVKNDLTDMHTFILPYLKSNREFEVRFAVVLLMDYYLTDAYYDETLKLISEITHSGYYVKMAAAWAVSVAFIKNPEKGKTFLASNVLDEFTQNKAISKIRDSYRVLPEDKVFVKAFRRKK